MVFPSRTVALALLTFGCSLVSCSSTETRLVSPDGKGTLSLRCGTRRALQGDPLPHLATAEECRSTWQVEGWTRQPALTPFLASKGLYVAIEVDLARHLIAATRDRRHWEVWFVDGKSGETEEAVSFEREGGAALGLAAIDLDRLVADTFAQKQATFERFWRRREGDAALERLYARGATLEDDSVPAWVRSVRALPPEAVARVEVRVRDEVRERPSLASVFHLLALDERGPADDPELRPQVWAVAIAALSEKDTKGWTVEGSAAAARKRQRQLDLFRTLLAGDGFGSHPQAGTLACKLVAARERFPHVVLGLARASERGERCEVADAAWFDESQSELACIELDGIPVEGFATLCDGKWRVMKQTVPVEDGVTSRSAAAVSQCLKAGFGVQVWSLRRELGFGDRPSRVDRLAYRFDVDPAVSTLDKGQLARTVCALGLGETTTLTVGGGAKVIVDDAKKSVRVIAQGR